MGESTFVCLKAFVRPQIEYDMIMPFGDHIHTKHEFYRKCTAASDQADPLSKWVDVWTAPPKAQSDVIETYKILKSLDE